VVLTFAGAQLATLESAGASLDLLRLEPLLIGGIYPAHGEDRLLVRLDDVPETLVGALLAIEDRGFYSHHGASRRAVSPARPWQTCAPPPWSPAAVRSRSSWSRTTT
jgi:penicillin-binding protein 1B